MDWASVRTHSGLSITYLKHASVLIKDVDAHILVDPIFGGIFWFMSSNHMNPAETVQAFQELGARRLMIVHWGTFRLGDEPVHFPPHDLKKALQSVGLSDHLVDLSHGQTFYFS